MKQVRMKVLMLHSGNKYLSVSNFPGMKKIFMIMMVAAAVAGCNSDGNGSSSEDTTGSNTPGIENVNGNLPDTTNSINLDSDHDTTHTRSDTSHRH